MYWRHRGWTEQQVKREIKNSIVHYIDVIMTTMASQITSLMVVYTTVYSDADQRKHQTSASLAFVWGIHRDRWIPRTKGQLRGKYFYLMTSSCQIIKTEYEAMGYVSIHDPIAKEHVIYECDTHVCIVWSRTAQLWLLNMDRYWCNALFLSPLYWFIHYTSDVSYLLSKHFAVTV